MKVSSLLTPSEASSFDILFSGENSTCEPLATAIVQLYETTGNEWTLKCGGVLYLVLNIETDCYFFQLYSFDGFSLLWEYEIYQNINYVAAKYFFHMFESDETIVAFNFVDVHEARNFHQEIKKNVIARYENGRIPWLVNKLNISWFSGLSLRNVSSTSCLPKRWKITPQIERRSISDPMNFRHLTHVGFDRIFSVKTNREIVLEICKLANLACDLIEDQESRDSITEFIVHKIRESIRRSKRNERNKMRNSQSSHCSGNIDDLFRQEQDEESPDNSKIYMSLLEEICSGLTLKPVKEVKEMDIPDAGNPGNIASVLARTIGVIEEYADYSDDETGSIDDDSDWDD